MRSGTSVPLNRPLLANRSYIAKHNRNSGSKNENTTSSQEALPHTNSINEHSSKKAMRRKVELNQRFASNNSKRQQVQQQSSE